MLNLDLLKIFVVISVLFISCVASAEAFEKGDVFGSIGNGLIVRYDEKLQLIETISTKHTGETTGMAFDEGGNLYVTNFRAGNITRFDGTGTTLNPNPFVKTESGNESIVFDSEGNFYVGVAHGSSDIFKFNSEGTLLDRFDVAKERVGSDWIDLANDQRTIFYTSEGRHIFRYDVSTKTQLSDFVVLPEDGGTAFALRILPNGGVLVADRLNIKRLNAEGDIVQTYGIADQYSWFALNLDPDGISFWSGDQQTQTLARFNIETGEVMATVVTPGGVLYGVAVYGEVTVARPAPLAITIKNVLLILVGIAVAVTVTYYAFVKWTNRPNVGHFPPTIQVQSNIDSGTQNLQIRGTFMTDVEIRFKPKADAGTQHLSLRNNALADEGDNHG